MSGAAPARATGLPLDRLFALYLLACVPALVFPYRPGSWWVVAILHVGGAFVLWPERSFPAGMSPAARRAIRSILDWLPLLLVPLLYKELALLNRAVYDGAYFDALVIGWEQAIFGGQPSSDWAQALPHIALSEPLHSAYLSYYFIIFVPPLLLFLRGRTAEFRNGVFALMLAFFAHYIFFIYFPVQGPRYLFPAPGGEIANGFFYRLAHRVLEVGSAQGAAFPSSHVGVSVAQTLVVWRYLPRLTPVVALLTLGLALGAIYGGFHYATDAIAGLLLGAFAFAVAPHVMRRIAPQAHVA